MSGNFELVSVGANNLGETQLGTEREERPALETSNRFLG